MPRHDREQLRLSMTADEWAKYERDERAMLESIPRADEMTTPKQKTSPELMRALSSLLEPAAPPSPAAPETLAHVVAQHVEDALADDSEPGETRAQIAKRLLAEGISGRWTPPSGESEPTPEAQAYWAAVRARLTEIAGSEPAAPETPTPLPSEPTPGEHYWLTREQMAARWPSLAAREPFIPSCLWCGVMQARDPAKRKPCRGRVAVGLRTETPPTPSLAEAARLLLYALDRHVQCPTWERTPEPSYVRHLLPGGVAVPPESCPACALRAALAAEEARDRRQREAARLFQRDDVPANLIQASAHPDGVAYLTVDLDTQVALRLWARDVMGASR